MSGSATDKQGEMKNSGNILWKEKWHLDLIRLHQSLSKIKKNKNKKNESHPCIYIFLYSYASLESHFTF